MADIFLSYARENRAIAERLASAIEASGKSVWWDRHIKGGAQFSKDIERELYAATHVLVLWSAESIESRWVRDEASHAADSGRLIGATIDGTTAPLGFGQFHTVDLLNWSKTGAALPPDLMRAIDAEDTTPSPAPKRLRINRKHLLIAATAIALTVASASYFATQGVPGTNQLAEQQVTLAVLPFISGDPELAASGIGLSSALNNGLSSASGLAMIASTSTAAAASRNLSAQEIGTELGATHLLEGQILPRGEDEVQFILSLIDTSTGRQVWTDTVDGGRQLSPRLTRRLVEKVGLAMAARFGTGATSTSSYSDISPEAYDAYISALEKLSSRFDENDRVEAYRLLRRVTRLSPDFASGHAALALIIAHSPATMFGEDKASLSERFDESVRRALELDPGNAQARAAQVIQMARLYGEVEDAISIARKLLDDHPQSPVAHEALAIALEYGGHHREAHVHFERVVAADPLSEQKRVNMLANYTRFGTFAGLERLLAQCPDCSTSEFIRVVGLLRTDGTIRDFERVWPAEARRLREEVGVPSEQLDDLARLAGAFLEGRRIAMPVSLRENANFMIIMLAAGSVSEEEAIDLLSKAADADESDLGYAFLDSGRAELPPAVRAHPVYHSLFQANGLENIVAYRRKHGFMAGLPIEPEEVEAEKRRLAELGR